MADSPQAHPLRRIRDHVLRSLIADDVSGLSAEIAFRFLFAVFPFGLFVAALGSFVTVYFRIDNPADELMRGLGDNLPPSIAEAIRPELERLMSAARPELVGIGAVAALWAATGGINAVVKGMHRAYEVEEIRPFAMRYAVAVVLTLLGSIVIVGSFVTIIGSAMATEDVARGLGVGELTSRLLSILRWPALFLVLTGSVALLYRYGPSVTVPWRWILVGAGAFAAGWLIATAALGYYVGNGANYGATYGSLGAVIVLMTWFFVTGALLMTGAEITAALVHELTPDAIHRRGAEQAVAGAVDDATSGILDRGLRGGSPGDRLGS